MIIKKKDLTATNLVQLEAIKALPNLPKDKASQVEREIQLVRSGNKGEQDSAYFIDFYYKDSKNWAIIHDLRIEYNDLTAQIDHLLINRRLDFYVLETKHYSRGIKITDQGEFLVLFGNQYISIESPIEQNKRHLRVLTNLLHGEKIMPQRLGITLQPNFLPYILVSPKSRVIRPNPKVFKTNMIIKSDQFYNKIQDNIDNEDMFSTMGALAKIISQDSLQKLAQKIVSFHQPTEINYYERFGINELEKPEPINPNPNQLMQKTKDYFCFKCKKSITKNVAVFCFNHKTRFGGKAYCYDCQKNI